MTMQGKVTMVTGATSGIGEASAKALAEQGAEVFIVCRNRQKGEALLAQLSTAAGQQHQLLVGDLSRKADIRRVAEEFLQTGKPLHLLLNNAGVVNTSRQLTADGVEETFAVNHLAYFLLTELLRQRIIDSAPARIVSVASEAHNFCKAVNFDDLGFEQGYKTFTVYGHSKLCNILWTRELARQLEGTGVTANCVHPGAVRTGLGTQNGWFGKLLTKLVGPFFRSPAQGAATSLHVATSPQLEGVSGKYFSDKKEKTPKPWAQDDQAAQRLWEVSAAMVDLA